MSTKHKTLWKHIAVDHPDGSQETWTLKDDGSLLNPPKRVRRLFKVCADNIRRPCTIQKSRFRRRKAPQHAPWQVEAESSTDSDTDDRGFGCGTDTSSDDASSEKSESSNLAETDSQTPEDDRVDGSMNKGCFADDWWSSESAELVDTCDSECAWACPYFGEY